MGLASSTLNPANSLIFFPESNRNIDGYIHNRILSSNGNKIPLYYHVHDKSVISSKRKCLIYSHGNASTLESLKFTIREFMKLEIDLVFYDYQGYGYSNINGNVYPCENACVQNLKDIAQYLKKLGYLDKNMILYGRSLGSGVSIKYISENSFNGKAIVVCPFTSICEVGGKFAEKYLSTFDVFRSIDHIEKVKIPVFFIHTREDRIVPFDHGQRLFQKYKNNCHRYNITVVPPLWVDKGDHNTFEYQYGFNNFIEHLKNFISSNDD